MTTQQPTREQVVQLARDYARLGDAAYAFADALVRFSNVDRADLEATVSEQAAEIARLTASLAESRDSAGFGSDADPMESTGWAALGDPGEVPAFIDAQFKRLRQQLAAAQLRIEEQAAEIEQLKSEIDDVKQVQFPKKVESVAEGWRKKLAAAQLLNEQLREALREAMDWNWLDDDCSNIPVKEELVGLLSTQPDISALEAERQRVAEACGKVCRNPDGRDVYGFATAVEAGQWKDHMK